MPRGCLRPTLPILAAALWLAVSATGFTVLLGYASIAGPQASVPDVWPREASLPCESERCTLVVLVHPQCPCSRSSIDTLEEIMTRCQGRVAAHVFFYRPASFPENWEKTALWDRVTAFPGMQAHTDEDGELANLFGASTSGQVVVYGPDRGLLFSGGITGSRGHGGPNAGRDAVETAIRTALPNPQATPVFGCPLRRESNCNPRGFEACRN